jgi:glyoxylase I family protein
VKSEIATIALVVADLERATRFYCQGLGFTELQTLIIGDELAHVGGVAGAFRLHERFIKCGATIINLLYNENPAIEQTRAASRHRQLGFSHIVVRVDDLEAAIAGVLAQGGDVDETTRAHYDNPDPAVGRTLIVNCYDPEGNRIELIQMPDSAYAFLHTPKGQG